MLHGLKPEIPIDFTLEQHKKIASEFTDFNENEFLTNPSLIVVLKIKMKESKHFYRSLLSIVE